jgi:hypothetical protein
MRAAYRFSILTLVVAATIVQSAVTAGAAERPVPVAPGKFIPTFAVKYGGTPGWPPVEEAARFDLLDVSSSIGYARVHASRDGNTWQTLKKRNPHLKVFLYKNGPALYNVAAWGELGRGWEWIKQNHGPGCSDCWTTVGVEHGSCLQGRPYPNERLMNLGNSNWQQYWTEETYQKYWAGPSPLGEAADGIFADNCGYHMPWQGQWHVENDLDRPDRPTDYTRDDMHQAEQYKAHILAFHNGVVPWLADRDKQLVLNFGNMARSPEDWLELDRQPHPVFAAMEEGAFVHPWGTLGREGNFVFWPEKEWLNQVRTMRELKQVRALMNVHGPVISEANDLGRMDAADASGNRAWDVLWYALTSFLQGYDDMRQNAYMNFTVWGYNRFYWFDEFDPEYLHLGRARNEFRRAEGTGGHVYVREFDDGWVVVNPTRSDVREISVPGGGTARVLGHDTFRNADQQPLIGEFELPSHRGVILLKAGRKVGNEDNG